MRSIYIFLIFCLTATVYGQETAVITGTVKDAIFKEIELEIDNQYIDNTTKNYRSEIIGEHFRFEIKLPESQLVAIKYLRQVGEIYVEPGDSLHIDSDANAFQYAFKFSGKGAPNNIMLRQFRKTFPEETNEFQMMQYRKGIVWYKAERKLDKKMRNLKPNDFRAEMERVKTEKFGILNTYENEYKTKLSERFKDFMWSEIHYDWAYNLLVYGYAFGNWHSVDQKKYFSYLGSLLMQNDLALNNIKYRNFLEGVINYKCNLLKNNDNPYVLQIAYAKEHLEGRSKAYIQSKILKLGFKKKDFYPILTYYKSFIAENNYTEFNKGVIDAFELANRYAPGSNALAFALKDTLGNTVSLDDFKGKFVYINFWASWCRPCVRKMWELQLIADELGNNNIVFLHITFDKDVAVWKSEIAKNQFGGIHLIAPEGVKSVVAKQYNVTTLPRFFIVDEEGKFTRKPEKFKVTDVRKTLINLTSEQANRAFGTGSKNKD